MIHDLWRRQQPDSLLFLDVSLAELRRRKGNPDWPSWIFEQQERRLEHARSNATLIVDTDEVDAADVVQVWLDFAKDRDL